VSALERAARLYCGAQGQKFGNVSAVALTPQGHLLSVAFDKDDNLYVVLGHGGTSSPPDCEKIEPDTKRPRYLISAYGGKDTHCMCDVVLLS
jgi:hypothetical protein